MFKNAIKRVQKRTCSHFVEREHFRRSQWSIINGQCSMVKNAIKREQSQMVNVQWSKMRLSESRAELVRAMQSVSILGEANGQWQ